jgi:hypothetical protein
MINDETVDHYNSRLTVDLSNLKNLSTQQQDRVKHYGSQAEALLKNRDLAMFIHHYKFSQADALSSIRGHTPDDNSQRVAISNELAGIDNFVTSLKRAVYLKNRVGNTNTVPDVNT